jgi:hypothetical protein
MTLKHFYSVLNVCYSVHQVGNFSEIENQKDKNLPGWTNFEKKPAVKLLSLFANVTDSCSFYF